MNAAKTAAASTVATPVSVSVDLSNLLIFGHFRRISCMNIIESKNLTDMTQYTYIIKYKEPGKEWSQTSYTSPEPVTKEYLVEFFGLEKDCEDYLIEEKH